MHVGLVVDDLSPFGGLERSSLELTTVLARRGHRLEVFYANDGPLRAQYEAVASTSHVRGELTIDPKRRIASLFAVALAGWRAAPRVDVAYVQVVGNTLFARCLARGRPVVCHLRIPPPPRLHRANIEVVDRFVAVSHHTAEAHIAAGYPADRIDVVHTGIDTDHYRPSEEARARVRGELGLEPTDRVVLYAGRLDGEKGIEDLLAAMDLLPPTSKLVLVGSSRLHSSPEHGAAYVSSLRQRISPTRARWAGLQIDVRPYFAAADVVAVPSTWAEPLSRVPIEAMACGRPVVATRVGGTPEILTGRFERWLVRPREHGELAERLTGLLDWRTQQPALGSACRSHIVEHFGVDSMANGVESVLNNAALGPHTGRTLRLARRPAGQARSSRHSPRNQK